MCYFTRERDNLPGIYGAKRHTPFLKVKTHIIKTNSEFKFVYLIWKEEKHGRLGTIRGKSCASKLLQTMTLK